METPSGDATKIEDAERGALKHSLPGAETTAQSLEVLAVKPLPRAPRDDVLAASWMRDCTRGDVDAVSRHLSMAEAYINQTFDPKAWLSILSEAPPAWRPTVRRTLRRHMRNRAFIPAGWTALHWVAVLGHHDVARCLLQAQVLGEPVFLKVELRDEWGMNALHWAAYLGHAPVVAVLLEARQGGGEPRMSLAAINALDKQRRTVLHWAGKGARGSAALWALATRWRSLATHAQLIQQLLLEKRDGVYCFQRLEDEDRHATTAFAAAAVQAGRPHDLLLLLLKRSEDEASSAQEQATCLTLVPPKEEAGLGAPGPAGPGSRSLGGLRAPGVLAMAPPAQLGLVGGCGGLPSGAESMDGQDVVAMLLHVIAREGHEQTLVQLLVQLRKLQITGEAPVREWRYRGRNLLHTAAQGEESHVIRCLLKNLALVEGVSGGRFDVLDLTEGGKSALDLAVEAGHVDNICALLLSDRIARSVPDATVVDILHKAGDFQQVKDTARQFMLTAALIATLTHADYFSLRSPAVGSSSWLTTNVVCFLAAMAAILMGIIMIVPRPAQHFVVHAGAALLIQHLLLVVAIMGLFFSFDISARDGSEPAASTGKKAVMLGKGGLAVDYNAVAITVACVMVAIYVVTTVTSHVTWSSLKRSFRHMASGIRIRYAD